MPASVVWLKPLSKFVLEVSPLVSALLIGAYLISGAEEAPPPVAVAAPGPELDTAMLSGEAVTAMIKQSHDAVALKSWQQQEASAAKLQAPAPTLVATPRPQVAAIAAAPAPLPPIAAIPAPAVAVAPVVAKPPAKVARASAAAKPAPRPLEIAERHDLPPPPAATTPAPAVTPPAAVAAAPQAAEPQRGVLRRTWGTVADWSGAVAHATKIDYAADVVAETPSAVARAGRKTWQAFTSILPDEPRR